MRFVTDAPVLGPAPWRWRRRRGASPVLAWDTGHLQGLLDSTPAGGRVQANSTPHSPAWAATSQGGLPPGTISDICSPDPVALKRPVGLVPPHPAVTRMLRDAFRRRSCPIAWCNSTAWTG
jgi:hypothetical protein